MSDQFRVVVRTQHQHEGQPCQHTQFHPVRSLGEALSLAEHPPLSTGYTLVHSEIEHCSAWRRYDHGDQRPGPES